MEVIWNPSVPKLTVGQWYFPPALLKRKTPEAAEYCRWVVDGLRLAVRHRPDEENQQALEELEAIQEELI